MILKRIVTLFFIIGLGSQSLHAQEYKIEVEKRVDHSMVPEGAKESLKALDIWVKKVAWFKEVSDGGISYEAKFKFHGSKYSMEFDAKGGFQDIEVLTKWRHLPKEHRLAMEQALKSIPKFKLQRIQGQWSGPFPLLLEARNGEQIFGSPTAYEVEFKGLVDEKWALWEGLFKTDGELLHIREFRIGNLDNLNLH